MAWILGTLRLTSIPDTETDFLCHQIGNFLSDVKKVKQVGIQKVIEAGRESIPEPLARGAEPHSVNAPHPYGSVDQSQPRERWSEGHTR